MARFCSNCGAGLDEAAKFCMGCGTQAAGAPPIPEPVPEPVPEPAPIPEPAPEPVPEPAREPIPEPEQQQYIPPPQPYPQQPYPQQPYPQQPYPQQSYPQQPYQQQPYPQQPYPQQPYAPAPAPAQKKSKKGLAIALTVIAAFIVGVVAIAIAVTGGAAKKDYYVLGKDQIPSVKLVLGEVRKIASSNTATQNGATMKEYRYNEPGRDQAYEMSTYLTYLRGEGFLLLTDADFYADEAWCKVARNSVDAGYWVVVQIEYDTKGYVITLLKEQGEVVPLGEDPVIPGGEDPEPPEQTTAAPGGTAHTGLWRAQAQDSDGDDLISLITFNRDGSFSWSVYYVEPELTEYNGTMNGSYTLEDGEIFMFDIEAADGRGIEDMTCEYELSDNAMTLDDDYYTFVEPRDRRKVMSDPLLPYPPD